MLLEFKVKNYKSFVDMTTFSMMAAPKQKGLDYSVYTMSVNGKKVKGLCSSVIYGPNASGKTNIIGAMDTLRAIVLRGDIRNEEEKDAANPAASALELIPNKDLKQAEPVFFSIDFMVSEYRVKYELLLDIGAFLETKYKREIREERLFINEKLLFEREKLKLRVDLKLLNKIDSEFLEHPIQNQEDLIGLAEKSLRNEELFLTNGFKMIFSPELVTRIYEWFYEKFTVICRADSVQLSKRFGDFEKKTIYVDRTVNQAAKIFGVNSNAVGYAVNDESETRLYSVFENTNKKLAILADVFESYGTIRFVNLFPLVLRAIQDGGVLVIDEFDASIHPMALMSIINVFHNDDINQKHAQLIFNTHNPIFLCASMFRRDEIKFVERDDESCRSELYTLADFGTTGSAGVRKGEDYMKNYFVSQYGAIKDIDFSPVFEELLALGEES